jgi:hypothetical protein
MATTTEGEESALAHCARILRAAGYTCLADELAFGALAAVEKTEPLFVLCGRDRLAPQAVKGWIELARLSNVPDHKLESAHLAIEAMERWPGQRHYPD